MARRHFIASAATLLSVGPTPVRAMSLKERSLSPEEEHELDQYTRSGRRILGVPETATPTEIVLAVDDYVDAWPRRDAASVAKALAHSDQIIDLSWALGALWGMQVVQEFKWSWTIVIRGDAARYGVVTADRALAIFPSYFVRECLYDASRDFTAMLMFNMLRTGRFNSSPPNGYLDLSETVTRIVPRR